MNFSPPFFEAATGRGPYLLFSFGLGEPDRGDVVVQEPAPLLIHLRLEAAVGPKELAIEAEAAGPVACLQ